MKNFFQKIRNFFKFKTDSPEIGHSDLLKFDQAELALEASSYIKALLNSQTQSDAPQEFLPEQKNDLRAELYSKVSLTEKIERQRKRKIINRINQSTRVESILRGANEKRS
jgi:hypothetical protein